MGAISELTDFRVLRGPKTENVAKTGKSVKIRKFHYFPLFCENDPKKDQKNIGFNRAWAVIAIFAISGPKTGKVRFLRKSAIFAKKSTFW